MVMLSTIFYFASVQTLQPHSQALSFVVLLLLQCTVYTYEFAMTLYNNLIPMQITFFVYNLLLRQHIKVLFIFLLYIVVLPR